jgi:alginate O-acetyltransferase complex protein AlgI
MTFISVVFLIFAAVFFTVWRFVPPEAKRTRWLTLIVASSVFYGWWNWRFLFLLAGTGAVDFLAGLAMVKYPARKKLLLVGSMACNIGVLGLFKYLGFFLRSLDAVVGFAAPGAHVPVVSLLLPIGISFYTFQSMSYTIDVYKGHLKPTRDPLHFFAMISLFPHLVAGPILRARRILPQLADMKRPTDEQRWDGATLIATGYFKKVVLADNLAPAVAQAFAAPTVQHASLYWWAIVSMFMMQLYFDFSGYTDIARGLAKWMGIEFPVNFRHPYFATSLRDFWQRWHISLMSWWMEYVYGALGAARKGELKGHRNLWITMLLSGLWHGAAWTFVLWGGLHAFYLSLERIFRIPNRLRALPGGAFLAWLLLIAQVWISAPLFRGQSLLQAVQIMGAMLDVTHPGLQAALAIGKLNLLMLLLAVVSEVVLWSSSVWMPRVVARPRLRTIAEPAVFAFVAAACIFLRGPGSAFVYFQF